MIILWKPQAVPDCDWHRYCHCWKKQAAVAREEVLTRPLTDRDQRQVWDCINELPGRLVAWVRPEFIPLPSFFDELDYLRHENQYIVVQQRYDAVYSPGFNEPTKWTPNGVSRALVVFQFTGQSAFTLPPSARVKDLWGWLARTSPRIYHTPQRFSGQDGQATSRSRLGVTVVDPFLGAPYGTAGRIITGGAKPVEVTQQLAHWRDLVNYWELWTR